MATLALRVPTTLANGEVVIGGHCYIIFTDAVLTVRELINEKVRAELRKLRAGGPVATSLPSLFDMQIADLDNVLDPDGYYDAQIVQLAIRRYEQAAYRIVVDGTTLPLADLDGDIYLERRTRLAFVLSETYQPPLLLVELDQQPPKQHSGLARIINDAAAQVNPPTQLPEPAESDVFVWQALTDPYGMDVLLLGVNKRTYRQHNYGHFDSIRDAHNAFLRWTRGNRNVTWLGPKE